MLVDIEGANLDHLFFKSNHVIECLTVHDWLSKLIVNLDFSYVLEHQNLVTFHDQTPHFFGTSRRIRPPVDLSLHRLVKVGPAERTVILREHRAGGEDVRVE